MKYKILVGGICEVYSVSTECEVLGTEVHTVRNCEQISGQCRAARWELEEAAMSNDFVVKKTLEKQVHSELEESAILTHVEMCVWGMSISPCLEMTS